MRKRTSYRIASRRRSNRCGLSPITAISHPVADCDAASRLFANGFEELCGWLFDLLENGTIVPMVEVATEYEKILCRRKETCTESMLRTTCIRERLVAKYDDILHFQKLSNYEALSLH